MVLLPLLAALAIYACTRGIDQRRAGSVLRAAVVWGVVVVAITEILSVPQLLRPAWVAGSWALIAVAGSLLWRRRLARTGPRPSVWPPLTGSEWGIVAGVAVIVTGTGLVALVAAPNN